MAGGGPKATPEGPPAGLGPRTRGATTGGGLVATAVDGLEVDLGDSGPRAASGGHGARVPSSGRRATNVQMGWSCAVSGRLGARSDGTTGAADLRSSASSGAFGIGLGWRPQEDLLLGCFCFLLFFSLSFLFYTAPIQKARAKAKSIPVPLSFFL